MRYRKSEVKAYARANMRGIWAAIPYPFRANGDLDEAGLRKDVRKYVDELKIDGFFFGGLVGEYWSLTMEDRRRGQQIVIEEIGDKAQMLAHTACMSLRDTIALTQHAQQCGTTYAIVGNPPISTREPDDLYHFFRGLCAEVDIGVSLFNTPICGYSLSPELIARIADIGNIFCIKNPQPVTHTDEVRRLAGAKIIICDPNEGRWLDNIINHKDQVYMSSPDPFLMQVPGRLSMREYSHKAWAGDVAGARAVSKSMDPVRRVADKWMNSKWSAPSVPISAIKAWGELLGFTGGAPRAPMQPLTADQKRALKQELEAAGLLAQRELQAVVS